MSLELVATPIGDAGDLTLRAIEVLKAADVVIGEERREVSKLLKSLGLEGKRMELLNEHSRDADLKDLVALCRSMRVALVTDCGTPGFCDPGARLVALCRSEGLSSRPIPGASSLMCLLSVSGSDMRSFLFRGFLPAEREERAAAMNELAKEKRPVILMDTPYRLGRLLSELAEKFPARQVLLGMDFTQPTETIIEAAARDLPALVGERKAEFILAMSPAAPGEATAQPSAAQKPVAGKPHPSPRRDSRPASGGGRKFTPGRRR
jgi:16S rRNA (cytidine1402-2'-O)-methyltransferase